MPPERRTRQMAPSGVSASPRPGRSKSESRRLTACGPGVDDPFMTTLQRAEAAEHAMSQELDRIVVKSVIYTSGERDPRAPVPRPPDQGKLYMIGHDPRLPRMPAKPTLFDFFEYRFAPASH